MTEGRATRRSFWALPVGDRRELRNFAAVMAIGLGLIGAWAWYRGTPPAAGWLLGVAAAFLVVGLAAPRALVPPFVAWMYLARTLGWLNTHLLLGLVFYTLFVVTGGIMRLLRYDPLDRRLDRQRPSYWIRRQAPLLPERHYERQF